MTRRMMLTLAGAASLALALPPGALAHEGHAHRVLGTVDAIDATHIEVTAQDGKKESYSLTKQTRYLKGTVAAKASDVTVGRRVALSVVEEGGQKTVSEVTLAGDAPASPHPHQH